MSQSIAPLIDTMVERIIWDTRFDSHSRGIQAHDDFAKIVSMGVDAVPHLIARLRVNPNWPEIVLLDEITGAQPFGPDAAGQINKIASAWVEWGAHHE